MRDGATLHVQPLARLRVEAGMLVFGREQQSCWFWGIPSSALAEPDPPLVSGHARRWVDDGSTLEAFLRFFAVTNRPFLPPCCDASDHDERRLVGAWRRHSIAWKSIRYQDTWTSSEALTVAQARAIEAGPHSCS
jgi:hypothetical protein